jgi:hypothetical protein
MIVSSVLSVLYSKYLYTNKETGFNPCGTTFLKFFLKAQDGALSELLKSLDQLVDWMAAAEITAGRYRGLHIGSF